jgi:hypothetical protein
MTYTIMVSAQVCMCTTCQSDNRDELTRRTRKWQVLKNARDKEMAADHDGFTSQGSSECRGLQVVSHAISKSKKTTA